MRIGRSFLVSLRGLLALVGLAIGFALFATLLFSGCTNGGYISTSGRQQNTSGLGGVPPDSDFVDWTKPASAQTGTDHPQYDGIGTP
jgi:hypothetical protein